MAGSGLRWLALPAALAGAGLLLFSTAVPDALVSEDGRLVAVRMPDGRVAVNRARPRQFVMQNWQRALGRQEIVQPRATREGEALLSATAGGFSCRDGLCLARHGSGAVVAHAADAATAAKACGVADLLVVDDATVQAPCEDGSTFVVTRQDLARLGSAEIVFREARSGPQASIRHAIAEPYRPWHDHRRFSREARGLAPWQPPPRQSTPKTVPEAAQGQAGEE